MWRVGDTGVRLVVQADDFGMCHAVNEGVVRAFHDGIVRQASVMAACPWYHEAAALALEHGIPVGLHQTLTCEWDHLRWGPLTAGASLRRSDGTFPRTVAAAADRITDEDATEELLAQAARCGGGGLRLTYLDVHMGMSKPVAYSAVSRALGVPFLYPGIPESLSFVSIREISEMPSETKKAWLLERLGRIAGQPGVHLMNSHPAVDGAELSSIARPDAYNAKWTSYYRLSDMDVLCDAEVRRRIDDLGITLTTVAEAFGG